jgi:hypothetical protein
MKTKWDYIAAYKEEMDTLLLQQVEDLAAENNLHPQPVNEKLKTELIQYTPPIAANHFSQTPATFA